MGSRIKLIQFDNEVDEYIKKQNSPQKEICTKLREIIFKIFSNIEEKMKWGVPSYGKGKFYFVALKSHVNLGFSIKGLSKEEIELFQGSGKTMRVFEIKSLKDINEKKIVKLLRLVN